VTVFPKTSAAVNSPGPGAERLAPLWAVDSMKPDFDLLFAAEDGDRVAVRDRDHPPGERLSGRRDGDQQGKNERGVREHEELVSAEMGRTVVGHIRPRTYFRTTSGVQAEISASSARDH
jgi:hypothetical protein